MTRCVALPTEQSILQPAPAGHSSPGALARRRFRGLQDYAEIYQRMQQFIAARQPATADEFWLLEHRPVFTQGVNGKAEHLLNPGDIEVVQSDRGGQITYHGPGQLICYLLLDTRRRGLGVRGLVTVMEQSVINLLAGYGLRGERQAGAPGIYLQEAKIAALGLRIRRGYSYHGISLNVNMDLEPFSRINPCGYPDLVVTQLADWLPGSAPTIEQVGDQLADQLQQLLQQ